MKSKYFNEDVKTETRYNLVPNWMRVDQRPVCTSCDYRIYRMQYRIAQEEASRRGGLAKDYMQGFYIRPIPACKRRRCLLDKLALTKADKK